MQPYNPFAGMIPQEAVMQHMPSLLELLFGIQRPQSLPNVNMNLIQHPPVWPAPQPIIGTRG